MDSSQLTISGFLSRAVTLYADRKVYTHGVAGLGSTTYREIGARVDRLAHTLDSLGVRRGDRVATLAWNHQRHLELYLALPAMGAVLHTVNVRLGVDQIREILRHAGSVALFVDPDLVPVAAEAAAGLEAPPRLVVNTSVAPADLPPGWAVYEELLRGAPAGPYDFPDNIVETEPAALCYSSATTGRPKGVVYSHRALYMHTTALCMADTWALSESDTVLPIVPMFHVNAWGIPFAAVWMGSTIVLPGPAPKAADIVGLMREHDVTFSAAVPTVWSDVFGDFERDGNLPNSLRMVVSGGAPLPESLLTRADRLGVPLVHSYGMTEAAPLVLVNHRKRHLVALDERTSVTSRLRQGLPVPGLDLAVVRDDAPVPWDDTSSGELVLSGPWVAESYLDDERSRQAFRDGRYHSGDVAKVDDEGYVTIVDRQSDMIKSGGEWISSVDLENALMTHDSVSGATVIGVPHERWDERPVAFVVLTAAVTDDQLHTHLQERVPRWWLPDQIIQVGELPLTSVGKYDKKRLREQWHTRAAQGR
ncbi:long-chain-fatty-acid--CoA ligase [Rhodococcus sp. NCIMB 12038]|uniref:long-chain-fatty-acid--CoA ligase n=1 Tax=Rhodococcus sp. NCIMB 12038 TaxID=933800 RepID=UPI000B3C3356|nr:long-chain-fatty-acid--CoA ligase [Rhodococcus sp. NCIMB 12038]OUS84264.1 hypothetical protein CA951_40280 [Rhodococcus sp. NCIMB 12038]